MTRTRSIVASAALVAIGAVSLAVAQSRQDGPPHGEGGPDMGMVLIEGLRATPGCLGVDAGRMMSGKNTIIAWFENKAAVKRWYYGEVHQGIIDQVMPGAEPDPPLQHVKDEKTPIMVVATITFANKPSFDTIALPISQISIELYGPLPGGAFLGSRLAPDTFPVPHMRDYTPPADAAGAAGG